jgi:tetratricopeptide (TPR) repeat protein
MSEPLPERALQRLLAVAAADVAPPLGASAAARPDLPARYQIVRELGRGGMGVVYEAYDQQLGRRCALKTIGGRGGADDELRQRFAREVLAAARLRHPHIAAVYDATPDYLSMQLIAGCAIDAIHRSERRLLVELTRDAARALHHAHEQGIVHRDVKPSNLLVEGRHVFVVDFGLAKEIDAGAGLSLSGLVLGTPAFMPPEQAQGRSAAVDARSDVYALGATLYHCLTGTPPFAAADLPSLLRAIVEDEPRPPRLDRDLDLVLRKCLAKEPAQRYASAQALADDLDRWLRSEPVHARRLSLGYRVRKLLQRRRALLRASLVAALLAGLATALVLGPIALRARAARAAASEAVALAEHSTVVLQDAAMFSRLGDLPSAQQTLDAGIARVREYLARHDVPRVHYLLARLLRARGQPEALVQVRRAIAADPALAEARFEHGLMLVAQPELTPEEVRQAVADLATPIGERSVLTDIDILFGAAELARLQGRYEQAMEMLQEVLVYDFAHVAARNSLMRVALALGDHDLARHYAVSAVDLQQGYGPIYLARERRMLPTTILGLEGALVDFSPQVADGLDNVLAWAHRGVVHLRRSLRFASAGNRDEAIAEVRAAIDDHDHALMLHGSVLHDELAGARNNRAVCWMQAERLLQSAGDGAAAVAARTSAETDLARATAADADLPEAHFNAALLDLRHAELLRRLGRGAAAASRIDAAMASLRRALACAPPDWAHARACRARLAAMGG